MRICKILDLVSLYIQEEDIHLRKAIGYFDEYTLKF